jgi:hypothetical protein
VGSDAELVAMFHELPGVLQFDALGDLVEISWFLLSKPTRSRRSPFSS